MKKSALFLKSGGKPGGGSPVKLGWGTGAKIVSGLITGKFAKDEYDIKTKKTPKKGFIQKAGEVAWDNTGGLVTDLLDAGAAYKGKKTKNFPYPWDLRFNTKKGLHQAEGTPKRKNFTD